MNLKSAALLGERFLPVMAEGGLYEKLGLLLEAADPASAPGGIGQTDSRKDIEAVRRAAREALDAYDASFFADKSMRLFPEYRQMGFAKIMGAPLRLALEGLSDGGADAKAENIATIAREGEGLNDLTEQVERLLALADYFGIEKRDAFEADAVAVIEAPAQTRTHSPDAMNRFIDRVETFQTIVAFCSIDQASSENNIRMIDGDTPLLVADMSVAGATRLQHLLNEVQRVHSAVHEIDQARRRLSDVGVSAPLLSQIDDERAVFRRFEAAGSLQNISDFPAHVSAEEVRQTAMALLALMDEGARINSVILRSRSPELPDGNEPQDLAADDGGHLHRSEPDLAQQSAIAEDGPVTEDANAPVMAESMPDPERLAGSGEAVEQPGAVPHDEPAHAVSSAAWYEFEHIARDRKRAQKAAQRTPTGEATENPTHEAMAANGVDDGIPSETFHQNGDERLASAEKIPSPPRFRSIWDTLSKR
ncbi:MAG: hypothetical protein H2045_05725 [Rhizobiales bacterium]|nr:hypothetical protein [Hyphomicrobiales bacterium]